MQPLTPITGEWSSTNDRGYREPTRSRRSSLLQKLGRALAARKSRARYTRRRMRGSPILRRKPNPQCRREDRSSPRSYLDVGWPFTSASVLPGGHPGLPAAGAGPGCGGGEGGGADLPSLVSGRRRRDSSACFPRNARATSVARRFGQRISSTTSLPEHLSHRELIRTSAAGINIGAGL